jgi:Bacterial regulatory proteins, luxR family
MLATRRRQARGARPIQPVGRLGSPFDTTSIVSSVPRQNLAFVAASTKQPHGQGAGGAGRVRYAGWYTKTVRNHVSNIFAKLHVADRAHAIARARDAGMGTPFTPEHAPDG